MAAEDLLKEKCLKNTFINNIQYKCYIAHWNQLINFHIIFSGRRYYLPSQITKRILRKNPCTNVLKEIKLTYARYKSKQKDALTLRQEFNFLRFVIESAVYQHWYPTFFIMANSGLRVGELTGLRWQDVDLDNGYIDVNHTLEQLNAWLGQTVPTNP